MSIAENFKQQVETFLETTKMTPTAFGKGAVGDPSFVFDLRDGRACSATTMDKVLKFIAESSPEKTEDEAIDRVEEARKAS